jgi:hypothetical protein
MHYHSKGYQQGLQGWPIDVRLRTNCISCMYESLNCGFMCVTTDLYGLKSPEYVSTLKKQIYPQFLPRKCSDTTCNIPDIKSIQNINKMLEIKK